MLKLKKSAAVLLLLALTGGCIVYTPPPAPVEEQPVVTGPGVVLIDVEPAPADRVYVYDPGYPPGCYFYNGYYWYGGYRYPHDVFVDRYVAVNIRESRYVNVEENRRAGARVEVANRQSYATNHGIRRPAQAGRPAVHQEQERHERQ